MWYSVKDCPLKTKLFMNSHISFAEYDHRRKPLRYTAFYPLVTATYFLIAPTLQPSLAFHRLAPHKWMCDTWRPRSDVAAWDALAAGAKSTSGSRRGVPVLHLPWHSGIPSPPSIPKPACPYTCFWTSPARAPLWSHPTLTHCHCAFQVKWVLSLLPCLLASISA